ncbi:hypothetical protein D3C83_31040 [compost metagenome]
MRAGPSSVSALATAIAPSRGGSISMRSSGPSAATVAWSASNRFSTRNCALAARPLAAAFASARLTSSALPSAPITCAPRRAIASAKLPMPQKRSATRSPG